jgi:hypothetical protein
VRKVEQLKARKWKKLELWGCVQCGGKRKEKKVWDGPMKKRKEKRKEKKVWDGTMKKRKRKKKEKKRKKKKQSEEA